MRALVDTGSGYTLIQASAVAKINCKINTRRTPPFLTGVTGKKLNILGMVDLRITIGGGKIIQQWVAVVPDHYLCADMLLGRDVLGNAPLTWNHREQLLVWGKEQYPLYFVKPKKGNVVRVALVPGPKQKYNQLRARKNLTIPPYQTKFFSIKTKETPGTKVVVHPEKRVNAIPFPFITTVNAEGEIYFPNENCSKGVHKISTGTLLGTYELGYEVQETPVYTTFPIKNELMPSVDLEVEGVTREEKLRSLLQTLNWKHLTSEDQKKLYTVMLKYPELFILSPSEVGNIQLPPAKINISDPNPVRAPRYRYPPAAQETIQKLLNEMEEKGIIEPSTAAWLSPIVLVKKPDGSSRMCLDYRAVNTHLAVDIYPLPRLEELVETAAGQKWYATLDLKDAYYQVTLHEDSRDITTFSDGVSLHRFRKLPFGLACSPAIFSRQIAQILAPLIKKGWVRNYLDDVVLWAPTFDELLARLETLFQQFNQSGVKLNAEKCNIGHTQVKFLGHIISEEGCSPDPANVEAVVKMQRPKRVKEVRRFLGMCGFYRKHIQNFAKIATPLTNLTRAHVEFRWTTECQQAFETLKEKLVEAPVLVRANLDKEFFITTDASNTHVGGVLSQIQDDGSNAAIGYFSRKLKSTENRYAATDKEALAVVLACRHFQHYLWNKKFTIITDHQPLVSIFKKKTKSPRMNRWILELREYFFDIKYIKGKYNYVADHLSRPVNTIRALNNDMILGKTRDELRKLQMGEEKWKELINYLEGGFIPHTKSYPRGTLSQFTMFKENLYFCSTQKDGTVIFRIVVPKTLQGEALRCAHDQVGHQGQKKTLNKAEEMFYWCNMIRDVINYVKRCPLCQQIKGSSGLEQQWRELPPVTKPLDRVGLDLTDMTAGSQGYRYVLTAVDSYSRYTRFYPLKTKRAEEVVRNLANFVADFGTPRAVCCDNGGEFRAELFRDFCRRHSIALHFTTPYNPRGNSQTERQHRTLKMVLTALCKGHPLRWPTVLAQCQQILNQSVHTSTAQQPYFAFFSRYAPRLAAGPLPEVEGDEEGRAEAHTLLQETQRKMCRRSRDIANRGRANQRVEVDTLVLVRNEVPLAGTCKKLNLRWWGPFRVKTVLRDGGAYILENVFNGQILQRTAEKVKPYWEKGEWVMSPQEFYAPEPVTEPVPARERRPPKRYIEEC